MSYLVVIFMICTYLCTTVFNLVILLVCKLDYRDQLGVQLKSYLAEGMFISTVSVTKTDRSVTLESLESGSLSLGLALRQVIRMPSHSRIHIQGSRIPVDVVLSAVWDECWCKRDLEIDVPFADTAINNDR